MCGICGVYGLEDAKMISKMCKTLQHRGPDDEGFYTNNQISLGHRRLSIIDLKKGHQPIHNEEETIFVILNGEIYNYRELKKDLEQRHDFYTDSDTEVIVHLYEEYGNDLVKKLNGMFVFALWDDEHQKLLLARDPLGKKPLYYHWNGEKLIFASEIKALFKAEIPKNIDIESLKCYLAYQYTLGNKTLFRGVQKLMGGHILTLENNKIKISQYWDIYENISSYSNKECCDILKKLLKRSSQYRIISDVPVGAFLSGGLDSSASVALTKPNIEYDYHTFSVGFESFSELEYAKIVSDFYDTIHHEIIITEDMVSKYIEQIAWHFDEPIGDAAIINNYFLSKLAKKYVKVVIAGEGGDELFAGYPIYKSNLKFNKLVNTPLFKQFFRLITNKNTHKFALSTIAKFSNLKLEEAHLNSTRSLTDSCINSLTNLNINNIEKLAVYPTNITDPLNRMLAMDCKNLLPEKFLMKADKATMANSIEERLPLLDKDIVKFSFSIPSNLKLKNGKEKYILKEATKDILPSEIIKRKKQGFGTPLNDWINHGELNERIIQVINDNNLIKKIFHKEKINKFEEKLISGNTNHIKRQIWTIFALGLWFDSCFEFF